MGNHDNPDLFTQEIYGRTDIIKPDKSIKIDNWRIIILNSHLQNKVCGHLDKNELDFLRRELQVSSQENSHAAIFVHHPALSVNSKWLDNIKLDNADEFLNIIANHPCVRVVFCGHVHQDYRSEYEHIDFFTTPSTSWQFAVESKYFKLDELMPGYRYIELLNDGSIVTEVKRVPYSAEFIPDKTTTGY
jgi:3',5'-cyclic-AMP phosphodiesterase